MKRAFKKSEEGFFVLALVMVIAVMLPFYFYASSGDMVNLARTRATALNELRVQDLFQQTASLVVGAYTESKLGTCTAGVQSVPGSSIQICKISGSQACVSGTDLCMTGAENAKVRVQAWNDSDPSSTAVATFLDDDMMPFYQHGGSFLALSLQRAEADALGRSYLPTPAAAPTVAIPTSFTGTDRVVCDNVSRVCLKLSICLQSTCSSSSDYYYQRIAFRK